MKKSLFLIVLTALLCLVCALALTACEEEPEAPAPEVPAPEVPAPEEPAHTHTWGEWVTVTPATCTGQGVQMRICECGQSESGYIPASHLPDGWESNGAYHWQVCTRTGCTAQVNKAAHTPTWSSDAARHWKDCTACGYGIVPATPHTYDEEGICVCGDYKGFQFTLSSGTYTVTDYTGTATEVVIPATYKGVAVTRIGDDAFNWCSNLTSVTIPASVTSIGDDAFYECDSLTAVTIPASVTSIGDSAFAYCTGLTSVTIPARVTSIGNQAFYGCSGLTSITVASGNTKYHSAGNCLIETATGTLVLGCKNSVIPADGSVTSIGDYAFYKCTNLTSVTIPASVTSIGMYAFDWCTALTSVTFANPNGWWRASSSTATSGTAIPAADLSNASTAAIYLKSTYRSYYWKRT